MAEIPEKIKENVRAVLLSKTDGKGVLVTDFLKDYKSILREPLMFKSLGYPSLPEFLKAIPDICRLEYDENIMAFKLFGIAKPNTYVSSFVRKAEGNSTDHESEREGKQKKATGELLHLGKDLNEDWEPNCRGLYTLCFPNRFKHLKNEKAVTVKFSQVGEVAEVHIIPSLVFVRFRDCYAAKKAIVHWGDELKLRRAEEKQPPPPKRGGGGGRSKGDGELLGKNRQKRNDTQRSSGKRNESDESDGGSKSANLNGHSDSEKKESVWSKVRQSDIVDIKEQVEINKNTNSSTGRNVEDKKEGIWSRSSTSANDGLLGKAPGCPNSGLLDSIGQNKGFPENSLLRQQQGLLGEAPSGNRSAVMNGMLAGPISPVGLGRATVFGCQATGHPSYVNPGPISRPIASNVALYDVSPIGQQEHLVPKVSPVSTGQPVNQRKPQTVSPGETSSKITGKLSDGGKDKIPKPDVCFQCGKTGHVKKDCLSKDDSPKITQVYIGNFPYTATQSDLEQLLRNYHFKGCKIVDCKNQRLKKYAFVDFTSLKEAERCIKELDQQDFQTRNLLVRFGKRSSELDTWGEGHIDVGVKNRQISPKSSQLFPNVQVSSEANHLPSPKFNVSTEEDDDDEMPPLEEDFPVIKRTIQNDGFQTTNDKTGHQPGSYVSKYGQESPEKMPSLETLSPVMPELEPRTPPRLKVSIPEMPRPDDRAKVFDARVLEEKMLKNDIGNDEEETVQLFISNFPYGTPEKELLDLFQKILVEQIVIMNNTITNRSTYAFVTVKNIDQAQFAILQLDQSLLKGRRLTVGMATPNLIKKKNRPEDPIARITCTVGCSDTGRHVSVDDTSSQGNMSEGRGRCVSDYISEDIDSYMSEGSLNRSGLDYIRLQEDRRNTQLRMTNVLKAYAIIVSKLNGEADFQQPVTSLMKVFVTHVEDNGYFFWGQVLVDATLGQRTNIETLRRISLELQQNESRPSPVKNLGRCAALYEGEWFRAWNMSLTEDGRCDILYIDYGNTAYLPVTEVNTTVPNIWNLPPIAKPFRLVDARKGKSMKGMENTYVTLEITQPGNSQSNFVANVHLIPEDDALL